MVSLCLYHDSWRVSGEVLKMRSDDDLADKQRQSEDSVKSRQAPPLVPINAGTADAASSLVASELRAKESELSAARQRSQQLMGYWTFFL